MIVCVGVKVTPYGLCQRGFGIGRGIHGGQPLSSNTPSLHILLAARPGIQSNIQYSRDWVDQCTSVSLLHAQQPFKNAIQLWMDLGNLANPLLQAQQTIDTAVDGFKVPSQSVRRNVLPARLCRQANRHPSHS